jgi:hypothetical protein
MRERNDRPPAATRPQDRPSDSLATVNSQCDHKFFSRFIQVLDFVPLPSDHGEKAIGFSHLFPMEFLLQKFMISGNSIIGPIIE